VRLLLLHRYGRRAASFRHRFEQFVPYLERAGFDCTLSSLLDDDYLGPRLTKGTRSIGAMARGVFRQLGYITRARNYDLIIVGFELFAYVPAIFERYFNLRGIPYIYDFDDPLFHKYDLSPYRVVRTLLSGKVRRVVAGAARVFAGSPYLVDYARELNAAVEYLPTVVDLDRYNVTRDFKRKRSGPFTIGWIGSPSTVEHLAIVAPALTRICERHDARVVIVGSGPAGVKGFRAEFREWSEARETSDILEFDVGLMPLIDDPWSRGKCGFKLVQYMASGIPVVASPVGVNSDMVAPGINGFLATDPRSWEDALEQLIADRNLCASLGAAGRKRVEQSYSVQVIAPRFIDGVRAALNNSPRTALR
jgi:glycosyltransferase involved in cell wall biosynthesis